MNTPVNFELAKLLKEKGFNLKIINFYNYEKLSLISDKNRQVDGLVNYNPINWNSIKDHYTSAPTIAEVVMWLYEKHDIYINVIPDLSSRHNLIDRKFYVSMFKYSMNINVQVEILKEDKNILYFNKLENAYEFGILHALKNLIS